MCSMAGYGILSLSKGTMLARSALLFPRNVGGQLLMILPSGKEGCPMVSFTDLIQVGILIVGIISLFIQANKK